MNKNLKIKNTLMETRLRRAPMDIKVFEVKVDYSHLSKAKRKALSSCFLEAKWIYNHLIGSEQIFDAKKIGDSVDVLVFNAETQKCDIIESRKLDALGSQIKQSMVKRAQQNIINLSKTKKKGLKVGRLKFLKEVTSLPLKQCGTTFKIKNGKSIHVQKVGNLKVRGLEQILSLEKKEIACANLIKKPDGYYLKITVYVPKELKERSDAIGIDFGIKDSLVFSNGDKISCKIPESVQLKRAQRRLSRKKKGSARRFKQIITVRKQYQKIDNQKNDISNKIINKLKNYETVAIQDENLAGWQKGRFGKQVQQSILGRIKSKIKNLETSAVISRWLPTTKICPSCHKVNNDITLNQRIYNCSCGFSEDRDVKAAKTIMCFGLNLIKTPMEHRSLPVEDLASVFANYQFVEDKLSLLNREATQFNEW